MNLAVQFLHPLFAAAIDGVDLRNPSSAQLCAAIDAAMNQYAVVVLHNHQINDGQQMAFARMTISATCAG